MEPNNSVRTSTRLLLSIDNSRHISCNIFSIPIQHSVLFGIVLLVFTVLIGLFPNRSYAELYGHIRINRSEGVIPENIHSKRRNSESFARGRILVEPRAGLPAQAFSRILNEHHGKARKIGQSNLYIVDLPEYSEESTVARLQHHPQLKFAELDYSVPQSLIPDDPYYGQAWHLLKIGTSMAWDNSQGNGITIAILDTGIDDTHPDLTTQIVSGWNFNDNNGDTSDLFGHGTAVAGTAAATNNNGIGVSSVTGQSTIMPIRVTDDSGLGYYSTIAQGLTYAADNGARVANASFQNVSSSATARSAAQYMKDKNGLIVVAAGNTGNFEVYSSTTSMIPVSATDSNDLKASWSSYGNYVALSAPGSFIWTTQLGGDYRTFGGTSIASPVAAGVIALMMSANPTLSSTEIENLLFSTALDLGDPGRDPYYGYGRVDAAAAIQAAVSALPVIDNENPTISIIEPVDGATVEGLVPVDIEVSDNIGVARVELWVNNTNVAVDSSMPFAFTWDSSSVPNGEINLVTHVFDATGNSSSSSVTVNVGNPTESPSEIDTEPPFVQIINPVAGNVSGNVTISVDATDNYGASGITQSIYINGSLVATGTGNTLAYNWNTRPKKINGLHTIEVIARDEAGNLSSASVNVNVIK